jgi:CRP-like cAMP-binding protein
MQFKEAREVLIKDSSFSDLGPAMLGRLLLHASTRILTPEELVYKQGEHAGTDFFLIVKGKVRIVSGSATEETAVRGPGETIGEIGILNPDRQRTADVIASAKTDVLVWDYSRLPDDLREFILPILERVAFDRISADLH